MRHVLVVALLFVAGIASAQQMVKAKPYLCLEVVDSVVVTSGSDTVRFSGADVSDADSAVAGQFFYGPGIPYGTTIATVISDSLLVLSAEATATTALATVAFTDFVDTTYVIGDVVGTPFQIPSNWTMIHRIEIVDADDVQDSMAVYIYDGEPSYDVDNTALSPSDAEAATLVGYIPVMSSVDLGASKVMYWNASPPYIIKRNGSSYWAYLVAAGAASQASQQPLTVIMWGE